MVIHVLVIGASEAVARVLFDAAREIEGLTVEAASDAEHARARLSDVTHEVHVLMLGSVENAPGVAQTPLAHDGRRTVHVLGAPSTVEAARTLLEDIRAEACARGERVETLLSMIAHDVRAPLGVALGALAEMTHPSVGTLTEEQQKLVRLTKRSLDRLSKLSVNLSQLARIETQRLVLSKARNDLGSIATDVARRIQRDEEVGHVRIVVDAGVAPCDVDREKVAIAIDNLVSNATRFARSEIVVRTFVENGCARLTVEDDGPGLPAGSGDVFDRVRVASMRTGKTGSGLGLAVVRGIARAHGGEAVAETITTDGPHAPGARFTLSFPALS